MGKQKIVIFKSAGGGGHTAAAQALCSYLGSIYDITVIDTFLETLKKIDICSHVTRNRFTAIDLYNTALAKRHITFLNLFMKAGRFGFKIIKHPVKYLFKQALKKYRPDCIISIIPVVNGVLLEVAQELNIPFFILPTDLDPRTYLYGIHNPTYSQFYFGRTVDSKIVDKYILSAGIKQDQIIDTGFIIRKDFFEKKDPDVIKKELNVANSIPIISIMLGSAGSDNAYTIAQSLTALNKPCHLIFCVGKHAAIQAKIEELSFPQHITKQVIGFTDNIADLMAISDIFISKPGPNSICEALQMNTPLVLANIDKPLFWEKLNITYVEHHNLGCVAHNINDLTHIIADLLDDSSKLNEMKKRVALHNNNQDIEKNMRTVLAHIFQKKEEAYIIRDLA